ncbi:hypothetical protein ACFVT2_04070 [Streptomyces sp. NPDC058000]
MLFVHGDANASAARPGPASAPAGGSLRPLRDPDVAGLDDDEAED